MAPTSDKEHIVLLFACIKNGKGDGKIDWNGVAKDTGITSNAASKRYRKLAEDNGLSELLRAQRARVPGARAQNVPGHEEGAQGDSQEAAQGGKRKRGQESRKGGSQRGSQKKRKMVNASSDGDDSEGDNEEVDYEAKDVVEGENDIKVEPEQEDEDPFV